MRQIQLAYGNRVEHDGSENKAMLYSLQTEISSSNIVKEKTMSFVEEKSNEKFLKRSYRINQVRTIEMLLHGSAISERKIVFPPDTYTWLIQPTGRMEQMIVFG